MIRNISFNDSGDIVVDTETHRERITRGVVLLTAEQCEEARKWGWDTWALDHQLPETGVSETGVSPPLYRVSRN